MNNLTTKETHIDYVQAIWYSPNKTDRYRTVSRRGIALGLMQKTNQKQHLFSLSDLFIAEVVGENKVCDWSSGPRLS